MKKEHSPSTEIWQVESDSDVELCPMASAEKGEAAGSEVSWTAWFGFSSPVCVHTHVMFVLSM